MKCPYCDSEFEIEALEAYGAELNAQPQENMTWDTAAGSEWTPGETEGLRVYTCNTCGGEIVADETTGASECPFCGNPVIMTGQFAGALKPDLVIPFKVDKKAAIAALHNHYKGKVLLPKVFKDQNHIKEVKGLYVPVWLFDTDADAHVRYKATRIRHWSDSQYNYTETSHFSVVRAGGIGFENVPVDGSSKMDDTLMESIEPYNIADAVDFRTAYLSGYLADKYDVDADASIQRANQRIKRSTEEAFADTVHGYATVVPVSSSIALENGRARYALYPVWILNTQWNGQKFTFAINGQTGKIVGDLPMDKGMLNKWVYGITGAVTAAVFGLSYLLWLL
jgi:DNA-directed RNA polymerase subunit RPC12/RpoP